MEKIALLSVSDKTRIVEFAKLLSKLNYNIIATGNTAKLLASSGIEIKEVADVTNFPEIFDGRVKTLHPKIFGGILLRRENEEDQKQAEENQIFPIDIVCVNLYPFEKTAQNPNSTLEQIIENIDIGGPSLIRASAKNYKDVAVLTNPEQYDEFGKELSGGNINIKTREKLAVEAFAHTANYDIYISNFLENKFSVQTDSFRINSKSKTELRYGENPHQKASIYGNFSEYFEVLHGKELSYNNILDLVAAVEIVEDMGNNLQGENEASCTIIKHNNPAGAAIGKNSLDAYERALRCDPVSSFGGIVAFTTPIDESVAEKLNELFLEVVVAPEYEGSSLEILMKKKNRRLLRQIKKISNPHLNYKNVPGGIIVQDSDSITYDKNELKVVTGKKPSEKEMEDLKFAWVIAKHTKSNAIVFAKDKATLGVGAGQMSRVDSSRLAYEKAKQQGLNLEGSVAASDAFFPFPDGLLEIVKCGATSVIQPGGSVRDHEVIEAADNKNISMVFTGIRHFKH